MNILILNEAFKENLGDKAINFCLKSLLQERFVEATIFEESYTGKPETLLSLPIKGKVSG